MSDSRTPEQIQADNDRIFMKEGPGIKSSYGIYVVARDRAKKRVLLGGLGGMGCGRMWGVECPGDENYSGFADAPEQVAPDRP